MAPGRRHENTFRNAVVRAGRFPHPVCAIECIETHMSWVFLTGDVAYKVKKPVKFAFGDFSTLEKRRFFCAEELRINRIFSDGIYQAVVPIGGSFAAPVFGCLPAIEHAVRMRQFKTTDRMDQQLEAGALSGDDLRALATRISAFQKDLNRADAHDRHGSAATIHRLATDNMNEVRPSIQQPRRYRRLADWSAQQGKELAAVFAQRKQAGFVRAGHGDLHLQNIVRIDGALQPFDALEFNPHLRWVDTLDDVAQTTMDLIARGRADFGFVFLNAYLGACGDYAGMPVFRFYMFYRAMVRAKVGALFPKPGGERFCAADDAYLRAADSLIDPVQPALIIAHGLSGSGKSTVFRALVGRLEAIRLRSDVERKRLHQRQPLARTHSDVGDGLYCDQSSDATYDTLAAHAKTLLQSGYNVLVDASFLQRRRRERFRALADRMAAPIVIVHFACRMEVLRDRIAQRAVAQRDASEADLAVLDWQLARQEPLGADELQDVVTVNADRPRDPQHVACDIEKACRRQAASIM